MRPTAIAGHAPWALTPLTCRSLAAFAAFPSIIYLAFAFERRWSSFQILIEVAIAGMALIAIAAIRARAEFDGDAVVVWGWRIGLAVALVLFIALRLAMAGRTGPLSLSRARYEALGGAQLGVDGQGRVRGGAGPVPRGCPRSASALAAGPRAGARGRRPLHLLGGRGVPGAGGRRAGAPGDSARDVRNGDRG